MSCAHNPNPEHRLFLTGPSATALVPAAVISGLKGSNYFLLKKYVFNVYLFLSVSREEQREREREGDTESEAGSRL